MLSMSKRNLKIQDAKKKHNLTLLFNSDLAAKLLFVRV